MLALFALILSIIDLLILASLMIYSLGTIFRLLPSRNTNNKCDDALENKEVTIIVPVRNSARHLNRIVRELLYQENISIKDIYLLVDPSTDDTLVTARTLQEKYSVVRVIDKQHEQIAPGISSSLRYGANVSQTDLIVVVTDDVRFIDSQAICKITALVRYKRVVSCLVAAHKYGQKMYYPDKIMRQYLFQSISAYLKLYPYLPGCFWATDLSTFRLAYPPFDHFTEDYEFGSFLYGIGGEVFLLNEILISEEEKSSFRDYFFQQVRWRMGNIASIYRWLIKIVRRKDDRRFDHVLQYRSPYLFYIYTFYVFVGVFLLPLVIVVLAHSIWGLGVYLAHWCLMFMLLLLTGQITFLEGLFFSMLISPVQLMVTVVAALILLFKRRIFFDVPEFYGEKLIDE